MTRECIPILFKLNSRNPNHSFNLAPSISYSGGGGWGGAQINQTLGLMSTSSKAMHLRLVRATSSSSRGRTEDCYACTGYPYPLRGCYTPSPLQERSRSFRDDRFWAIQVWHRKEKFIPGEEKTFGTSAVRELTKQGMPKKVCWSSALSPSIDTCSVQLLILFVVTGV